MENAKKYLKISIVLLVLFSALLIALISLTGAFDRLIEAEPFFLVLSAFSFFLSIIVWLFAWALLVRKRNKKPFLGILGLGFASVFGSLTPIQLGSDALRSIFLKDEFGIPFSESFSASMIVKGLKFSVLAIASILLVSVAFLTQSIDSVLFFPLISGVFVVLLAAMLFLLPLKRSIGYGISNLFEVLSKKIFFLKPLTGYFRKYSDFLSEFSGEMLLLIFLLAAFSWLLEFLALFFVFSSLAIKMPIVSLAVLFVLLAVLERTPITPRGILLVELVGFAFLSFPMVSNSELSVAEVGSVLVIFDVARLIVPTLISIVFYLFYKKVKQARRKQ